MNGGFWRHSLCRTHAFEVVRNAVAATDDHVRVHLVGERNAWHELCVERVVQSIACAILTRNKQAVGAVLRVLDIDVNFLVVDFVERLVIAIAQTEIQGELGSDSPFIFAKVCHPILALTITSRRTGNALEFGSIENKVRKAVPSRAVGFALDGEIAVVANWPMLPSLLA